MTLIAYEDTQLSAATIDRIDQANAIIAEYQADGYALTLRQLYYQFVARGLIENSLRSYKNLGTAISKGRMVGLVSWRAIEDRTRNTQGWHSETNVESALQRVIRRYALDPWEDQDTYVEIWVEKEALAGVIERIAGDWHCPYLACRGYMSSSEAWASAQRFEYKISEEGKEVVILHLGDHDPSGLDMTRDNQERLSLFANEHIDVRRLALNMDQIETLRPPPNPAKVTDSRAEEYIAKFGTSSWELDALDPAFLSDLISSEMKGIVDRERWDATNARQEEDKARLRGFIDQLPEADNDYD